MPGLYVVDALGVQKRIPILPGRPVPAGSPFVGQSGVASGLYDVTVPVALPAASGVASGVYDVSEASSQWTPNDLVRNAPRPTGPEYVRWEDYYQSSDTAADGSIDMQAVFNRVPAGPTGYEKRIVTMPAGTFVFSGFDNGATGMDGIALGSNGAATVRGIVGSGFDNTIIKPLANSATKRASGAPTYGAMINIRNMTSPKFANFRMTGTPQVLAGETLYGSGLVLNDCPTPDISLCLRGASPGYANFPPGETFGIAINRCNGAYLHDFDIDGRDAQGNRVCASPFGWNGSGGLSVWQTGGTESQYVQDARVERGICIAGRCGMPTWWMTNGIQTVDLWSVSSGSGTGDQSGSGFNHEMYGSKPVTHIRPVLLCWGPQNAGKTLPAPLPNLATTNNAGFTTGLHTVYGLQSGGLPGQVSFIEPLWDKTFSGTGTFIAAMYDHWEGITANRARLRDPIIVKNGVTLTPRHHPTTGWNQGNPATEYAQIH